MRIQTALCLREIRVSVEIEHFAVIGERLKSVGKAFGNDKGFVVAFTEHFSVPVQKGWGIMAQVNSDIKHLATQATYKFNFRMGRS